MAIVFTPRVDHPGTRPQPFLIPAFTNVGRKVLILQIKKVIRAATDRRTLPTRLDLALRIAAAATLASAQQNAPVITSKLKGSLNVRKRGNLSYTIGTNVEYARHVEFGTRPHPIVPVRAKILRFEVKG